MEDTLSYELKAELLDYMVKFNCDSISNTKARLERNIQTYEQIQDGKEYSNKYKQHLMKCKRLLKTIEMYTI